MVIYSANIYNCKHYRSTLCMQSYSCNKLSHTTVGYTATPQPKPNQSTIALVKHLPQTNPAQRRYQASHSLPYIPYPQRSPYPSQVRPKKKLKMKLMQALCARHLHTPPLPLPC